METEKIHLYQRIEQTYTGKSYLAAKVLVNVSATLFGQKPSTLVNLTNRKDTNLIELWDAYGQDILPEGLEVFELKRNTDNLVLLFYKGDKLMETLTARQHLRFLQGFGYNQDMSLRDMLEHLKTRYEQLCPHEIGIFLGIPLKDVLGYLGLVSLPCSYCGYWKVYGNPKKSIALFEHFRKTRDGVLSLMVSGVDPVQIVRRPCAYRHIVEKAEEMKSAV